MEVWSRGRGCCLIPVPSPLPSKIANREDEQLEQRKEDKAAQDKTAAAEAEKKKKEEGDKAADADAKDKSKSADV